MKIDQVRIGMECFAKVGKERVLVIVAEEVRDHDGRSKFLIRRKGERRVLPKRRAASALHLKDPELARGRYLAGDT